MFEEVLLSGQLDRKMPAIGIGGYLKDIVDVTQPSSSSDSKEIITAEIRPISPQTLNNVKANFIDMFQ